MTTPGEYQYERAPLPFQPAGYPPGTPPGYPVYGNPYPPKVDPTFAWTLAFAPLLLTALPFAIPNLSDSAAFGIGAVLNSVLALIDCARVRKAGVDVAQLWAMFLVPVYLIVRTVKAKSTPAIPVVWFVCLFASFVVANVTATPGPVTMDSHWVESQLARAVRAQYGVRVDVSCPANPVVPVGDNFSCDVTAPVDGSTASVYVTVTDSDGRYTWVLTQ